MSRAAATLVLLSACAASPDAREPVPAVPVVQVVAPQTEPAPAVEVKADPLADDHRKTYPRRAQLLRYGTVWLRRTGPSVLRDEREPEDASESPFPVVAERDGRVRIVAERNGLRLLLWVDRADLRRVVSRRARLATSMEGIAAATGGVELFPGLEPIVETEQGGAVRLTASDFFVEIAGWLPSDALGETYLPEDFELPEVDASIRPGTELRDRPGGEVLLRVTTPKPGEEGDFVVAVERISGPSDGWVEVRMGSRVGDETGGYLARGFVEEAMFVPKAPDAFGIGTIGNGRGWGGSHVIYLAEGTRFYDDRGELVGFATRKIMARLHDDEGDRPQVTVFSPWGFLVLRTDPTAIPPSR